jgi:MFS family permease
MTHPAPAESAPPNKTRLAAVLAAAFLGWMFDGMEMGLFPLIARPALLQMQQAQGIALTDSFVALWMGYATASFLVGAALGGVVFGWLGDKIGRVRAMAASILVYSIFTGLIYFAQEPWHLCAARFLGALGMGGEWSLGIALVMEVWPAKHRPLMAGVIGAAANVGFALIAVITIFFKVTIDSWRWVALIGAAPALLTFIVRLFVPESEKWQAAVKSDTVKTDPLKEIFGPKLWKTTLIATALSSVALIGTWGSVQWLPLWADKMAGAADPTAKGWTGMTSGIGAVIGCLLGAYVGRFITRRMAYFLLSLGSLISCAVLSRGIDTFGPPFLVLTFIVGALTAAFYGWLPLYLPELFPTRVRATGQGLSFNAGRILAAVGALQMGSLMQTFDGSYAKAGAVITLIYVVGLGLIWLAPETKGKPLPA